MLHRLGFFTKVVAAPVEGGEKGDNKKRVFISNFREKSHDDNESRLVVLKGVKSQRAGRFGRTKKVFLEVCLNQKG